MAKANKPTILITGATGRQGGAVWHQLRERGFPTRLMTRHPEGEKARKLVGHGTEIVGGDFDDPASLARALDGVSGVFSVQDVGEAEVRQGTTLVDAAKRARINHFVYASVGSADRKTGIPHFESKFRVEEHLRNTGMRYTIFRPVFFMENWLAMRPAIEGGTLALPLSPDTRLQMIAVDDIGKFVAMAFERPGHWQGRAVDLAGDELPIGGIVETLGRKAGRRVDYVQTPWDQFEKSAGREMTLMYRWFQDVGYSTDIAALRQENSNLMNFEGWVQSNWRPNVQTA